MLFFALRLDFAMLLSNETTWPKLHQAETENAAEQPDYYTTKSLSEAAPKATAKRLGSWGEAASKEQG